jgi:hypothetical protein
MKHAIVACTCVAPGDLDGKDEEARVFSLRLIGADMVPKRSSRDCRRRGLDRMAGLAARGGTLLKLDLTDEAAIAAIKLEFAPPLRQASSRYDSRRHRRPDVSANPARQNILGDFSCSETKHNRRGGFLRRIEINAVKPEKHDHGSQSRPFVAIDK